MTAGELRAAIAGLADDDEVYVRDQATELEFGISSVEGTALIVDLNEEANAGAAAVG